MRLRHKILTPFLILLTLFIALIMPAYAWFDNTFGMSYDLLGKVRTSYTSYFAKGTGTESDPYVIAEPEHLYNLAYLQNLGKFQTQTTQQYFEVSDINGNTIDIDFTDYHALPPIGNHFYPFTGIFNGNNSNLINLTIDGAFNQDIGLFGFMKGFDSDNDGDYDLDAKVINLFLENPIIFSNPNFEHVDYTTVGFHPHNDGILNHATGYIVGHLGSFTILENVFVEAATIDSFSNAVSNRSEYGLIGYNQSDSGYIAGGPRSPYNFSFNMANTYTALSYALSIYGTYYVIGETPAKTLSQVLSVTIDSVEIYGKAFNRTKATFNYSISLMRIYDPNKTIDEAFNLYDRLRELGYSFADSQSAEYSKENMDFIGSGIFYSTGFLQVKSFAESPLTPLVGSTFIPHAYPTKFLLYAKVPTNPLDALGWITSVYSGSGDLAYYTGFDINGNYNPGVTTVANSFASSGIRTEMEESLALAAIQKSENGEMIVVDPNNPLTPPDFYVFLVGVYYDGTPKNIGITSIQFEYQPQALEISGSLSVMQNVDFIHDVDTVRNSLATYSFSYLNFGYSLTPAQRLKVRVVRTTVNLKDSPGNQTFTIYIDYEIDGLSEFYFDIINLNNYTIVLKIRYGDTGSYTQRYSGTHDIILTEISASTIVVDPYNTT
ncbi:MAG: hypothetical protein RQ856_00585 [Candidatus Izemoplasmatales bacterium]|nr:hypothetical protein [Candidatus Izemoplasmatales bacterium]